jgi:hypothetical protein
MHKAEIVNEFIESEESMNTHVEVRPKLRQQRLRANDRRSGRLGLLSDEGGSEANP